MSSGLDITTIIFALILGHFFFCILAAVYMVQYKKESVYITFLSARVFSIIGWTFLLIMGESGNIMLAVIGNTSLMIAEGLQISVLLMLKGHRGGINGGVSVAAVAGAALLFLGCLFFVADSGLRITGVSILAVVCWIYPIIMLAKGEDSTLLHRVVSIIYALEIIPLILRAYLGLQLRGEMTLLSDHLFNTMFFAMLLPVMLAGNSGFILMLKEKGDLNLVRAATYDEVTNTFNRRTFLLRAQEYMDLCAKKQDYLSFLMMDLDDFKQINDTYGHGLGDQVLENFSTLCKSQLREKDLIGRMGGEEFAVVFKGMDEVAATAVAQRLCKAVENSQVGVDENRTIHYTVSVGLVTLIPDEGTTLEMLFKWSDDALYAAKRKGRNRVQLASAFLSHEISQ